MIAQEAGTNHGSQQEELDHDAHTYAAPPMSFYVRAAVGPVCPVLKKKFTLSGSENENSSQVML